MRFLDGVYVEDPAGALRFCWVKAHTNAELTELAQRIAQRLKRVFGIDAEACAAQRHRINRVYPDAVLDARAGDRLGGWLPEVAMRW
jgi:hypothetical protein